MHLSKQWLPLAGWVNKKMFSTYSHARVESKADAVALLNSGKPQPKKTPPQPSAPDGMPDFMNPAIQAEIQRQVQLALQGIRPEESFTARPTAGPRLLTFRGKAER